MKGLLFGLTAAVLLGISDLFAAKTAKYVPAITVARTAFAASTIIATGLLFTVSSTFTVRDTMISTVSGLLLGIALVTLYHGYKVASIGVIAPTSSVLLGLIPVLDGVRKGDRPSVIAWAGMAIGITAIGLATYQPGDKSKARLALVLGAGSGIGFGIAFALADYTSKKSGLSPVFIQRLAAGALLSALFFADKYRATVAPEGPAPLIAVRSPARNFGIGCGVFATRLPLRPIRTGVGSGVTVRDGWSVALRLFPKRTPSCNPMGRRMRCCGGRDVVSAWIAFERGTALSTSLLVDFNCAPIPSTITLKSYAFKIPLIVCKNSELEQF
jgi:hypothetical protein